MELLTFRHVLAMFYTTIHDFQWPRGLRRGSVVTYLLELRIRIPPGAWMSVVSVVCCQIEVSASG